MNLNPIVLQKIQQMTHKYGENVFNDGRFKVLITHELSDRAFLRISRLLNISITEMDTYTRIKEWLSSKEASNIDLIDKLILELTSDYGIQYELAQEAILYIATVAGITDYITTDATFVNALRFSEPDNNIYSYIKDGSEIPRLVTSLLANTTGNSPFIVAAENFLFLACVEYLYSEAPIEERNMFMILELINAGITKNNDSPDYQTDLDRLFNMLNEKNPNHAALKHYADYKAASGTNYNFIIQSCITRLKYFDVKTLLFQYYSKNAIDIERLAMTLLSNTKWEEKPSCKIFNSEMLLLKSILFYIAQKSSWGKQNFEEIFEVLDNLNQIEKYANSDLTLPINEVFQEYQKLSEEIKSEVIASMKKRNFYAEFK